MDGAAKVFIMVLTLGHAKEAGKGSGFQINRQNVLWGCTFFFTLTLRATPADTNQHVAEEDSVGSEAVLHSVFSAGPVLQEGLRERST